MEYNNNNLDYNVSIQEIAKWSENSQVTIPALQRGLVWSPAQIELLWDSLFRGIPIGSLVVCERIKQQSVEEINSKDDKKYFHLLDGQQRVNAIQLGFDDFKDLKNPKKSILWLDLQPTFSSNSTRNYLFRVTTTAHPWGYHTDDSANRLSASVIRNGLEKYERNPFSHEYIRPTPNEIHPFNSNYAVPLSILWEAYKNNRKDFKDNIVNILSNSYNNYYWAQQVLNGDKDWSENIDYIYNGLEIAANTKIIVLKTPENLLEETQQEDQSEENQKDITAIEHLFQRLNRQGTELNGEELSYSMIKAYWPNVKKGIDNIEKENKLMPASRLVSLAIRTIASEKEGEKRRKISNSYNVTNIRKLAKDKTKQELQQQIIEFINDDTSNPSSLLSCSKEIDSILGVNNNKNWGLPPVLRSSIAYESPELYLFLILLIRKFTKENYKISDNEEISKALTGIITWLKWFNVDNIDITNFISDLYYNVDELTIENLKITNKFIPKPEELEDLLKLPDDENNLKNWRFWNFIKEDNPDKTKLEMFLNKLRWNREILIYAQRKYIKEHFKNFDPSRKDLWENHNRPWDFDHILAKTYIYNVKTNNQFLHFCQEWRDSNGNMRAWPFEANRSDHATLAKVKITDKDKENSFIKDEELEGFSVGNAAVRDHENAFKFANSCRSRMIRMYKEWYTQFEISKLLLN